MSCYQSMINRLCGILSERKLDYQDTIIIGDNSSGKSDVLKQLIKYDDQEKFYFIDAVNRYFDPNQIIETPFSKIIYSKEINKHRIDEDNFNHKDSFYYGGTPTAVEDLYMNYKTKIQAMMNEFLQIHLDIYKGNTGWMVKNNGTDEPLSSGYQALIRLFLECLYFEDSNGKGTIVIDEIDEFLSIMNCARIFTFLKEKFSELNFIVTTHSADLIANAENANLILLQNDNFEVLDAGDFSSVSQVYNIFSSLFKQKNPSKKRQNDESLRRLFNNKMSGIWDLEEKRVLESLKNQGLTKAQRLIVKQIEEWQS